MIAKKGIFTGRVQGVGFRYSIKRIAMGFDIQGSVRNLEDGTVEVQAMAWEEEELTDFFSEVENSHLSAFIKEVEVTEISPMEKIEGFTILR